VSSATLAQLRDARRQTPGNGSSDDYRSPGQRDRDRILYSLALRRLGTVTQVAAAGETQLFHTRLTHSLKVAQIGRRMAEKILIELPKQVGTRSDAILERLGGLDPDVVEAAGLAHDLGHPPFGHIAEKKLSKILPANQLGRFEGNAQSFRIVTKLSTGYAGRTGLDLTRAVLRALLKYPRIQGSADTKDDPHDPAVTRKSKWGVYATEDVDYQFAMQLGRQERLTLEAQIMDWADDISYAVHDLEDFVRAGLIPIDRLKTSDVEWQRFMTAATPSLTSRGFRNRVSVEAGAYIRFRLPLEAPYDYSIQDRNALHELASELISRYIEEADLSDGRWRIDPQKQCEVELLKQMTWYYVIDSPALASLQLGQQRLIKDLFDALVDWCTDKDVRRRRLPGQLAFYRDAVLSDKEELRLLSGSADDERMLMSRAVADYIASLTEVQAIQMHRRITGRAEGSAFEVWPRL
jgi:dGTPase